MNQSSSLVTVHCARGDRTRRPPGRLAVASPSTGRVTSGPLHGVALPYRTSPNPSAGVTVSPFALVPRCVNLRWDRSSRHTNRILNRSTQPRITRVGSPRLRSRRISSEGAHRVSVSGLRACGLPAARSRRDPSPRPPPLCWRARQRHRNRGADTERMCVRPSACSGGLELDTAIRLRTRFHPASHQIRSAFTSLRRARLLAHVPT